MYSILEFSPHWGKHAFFSKTEIAIRCRIFNATKLRFHLNFVSPMQIRYRPFLACDKAKKIDKTVSLYYEAEGGVLELLETGAPYAPHVKAKIF